MALFVSPATLAQRRRRWDALCAARWPPLREPEEEVWHYGQVHCAVCGCPFTRVKARRQERSGDEGETVYRVCRNGHEVRTNS